MIRSISYRLVVKTSLSFRYILKWNAIALIAAMSTAGGLRDNRGVWDLRGFQGIGIVVTPFSSCRIFRRLSLMSCRYVVFHVGRISAIWTLSTSLSVPLP